MGKRKSSSRPQGPKKKDTLPTNFTCLFCNHENSIAVKLDKKAGVGQLDCRTCGQKFQCAINYLSAAVDVYGEWVDAAESVAKEDGAATLRFAGTAGSSGSKRPAVDADVNDNTTQYDGDGMVGDEEDMY